MALIANVKQNTIQIISAQKKLALNKSMPVSSDALDSK